MADTGGLIYFQAAHVEQVFAKGGVLFEGTQTANCAVHASRREGPGEAELHASETDLMFIRSGGATLVIGGKMLDVREVGTGELRAARIDGGVSHEIGPGDVFLIPRGTPHWFQKVTPPLLYHTVKIR